MTKQEREAKGIEAYWREKYAELSRDHARLAELYADQQSVIDMLVHHNNFKNKTYRIYEGRYMQ